MSKKLVALLLVAAVGSSVRAMNDDQGQNNNNNNNLPSSSSTSSSSSSSSSATSSSSDSSSRSNSLKNKNWTAAFPKVTKFIRTDAKSAAFDAVKVTVYPFDAECETERGQTAKEFMMYPPYRIVQGLLLIGGAIWASKKFFNMVQTRRMKNKKANVELA